MESHILLTIKIQDLLKRSSSSFENMGLEISSFL